MFLHCLLLGYGRLTYREESIGLERVYVSGVANNSVSPKTTIATCPAGKSVISSGYDLAGAKSGSPPAAVSDVVADVVLPRTSYGDLRRGYSRTAPIRKQSAPADVVKFAAARSRTEPVDGTM